ncbi:MAG: DNA-packaging protein [Candidatus Stahlbacteria bacterium]|nr:MAG: DNA-packaging protein [Candidatus Stahlbacteria bacterium]
MYGNSFWKVRSSHGRNPIFKKPNDLWDACLQYFTWVEENPLKEEKLFSFQGETHTGEINKIRAMTIGGLCIFLGVSRDTWKNYKKKKDFLVVTSEVEEIIKSQKFEGAAADLLNANIIARDLGLKEKTELTGENGKPVSVGFYLPSNGREQDSSKDGP